jgi:hypothetical protein
MRRLAQNSKVEWAEEGILNRLHKEPATMRTFLPLFAVAGLMILLVSAAWAMPI